MQELTKTTFVPVNEFFVYLSHNRPIYSIQCIPSIPSYHPVTFTFAQSHPSHLAYPSIDKSIPNVPIIHVCKLEKLGTPTVSMAQVMSEIS